MITLMQKLVLTIECLLLLVWIGIGWSCLWTLSRHWKKERQSTKREWKLKPRTPEGWPRCQLEKQWVVREHTRTARPWSEVKSRRGRPKIHDTDGQACMNPRCEYYKDTDGTHHALRWDGMRNKSEA